MAEKPKLYYSIREASEMLGVKAHVLRYWESQFRSLRPKKNRAGNRMYQEKDLDQLRAIKELLYDRKYTIAGARRRILRDHRTEPDPSQPELEIEYLAPDYRKRIREVREDLRSLKDELEGDGRGGEFR
jgi:DNA-binding transcriptional MerR regulator